MRPLVAIGRVSLNTMMEVTLSQDPRNPDINLTPELRRFAEVIAQGIVDLWTERQSQMVSDFDDSTIEHADAGREAGRPLQLCRGGRSTGRGGRKSR